jgi:hypothetical protein
LAAAPIGRFQGVLQRTYQGFATLAGGGTEVLSGH